MRLTIDLAMSAEDVRDLETRPSLPRRGRAKPVWSHRRLPDDLAFLRADEVEWALGAPDVSLRYLGVSSGCLE